MSFVDKFFAAAIQGGQIYSQTVLGQAGIKRDNNQSSAAIALASAQAQSSRNMLITVGVVVIAVAGIALAFKSKPG